MGKLTNLLKWKKAIAVRDEKGVHIKDDTGAPVIVYMRVVGDKDLDEALTRARFASAMKRAALADKTSEEYITGVAIFDGATSDQCIEMIVQGRSANWTGEAFSNVKVPELPKIEEFAKDPDVPTLEEMERLDAAIAETEKQYRAELEEYVKVRETQLRADIKDLSHKKLIELAKDEVIIVTSVSTYLEVLQDEKVWRSVYQDEGYATPEFKNIEEFRNLNIALKDQLRAEYEALERGLDEIKN